MSDWPSSTPLYVTALPASPWDGQEIFYAADATNGINWHLRYRAGSASAYKWEFVGGPPLLSEVAADENTASASYVALTTAGPSVTLPLAGDFEVVIGARLYNSTAGTDAWMSYDIGGTGAVDADGIDTFNVSANSGAVHSTRTRLKTGLTAVTLTAKYRATAGTTHASVRFMVVRPVRVG